MGLALARDRSEEVPSIVEPGGTWHWCWGTLKCPVSQVFRHRMLEWGECPRAELRGHSWKTVGSRSTREEAASKQPLPSDGALQLSQKPRSQILALPLCAHLTATVRRDQQDQQ